LVTRSEGSQPTEGGSLFGFLRSNWPPGDARPEALEPFLERLEIAGGACLLRQGEASDALYFLEQGRLTAKLEGVGQSDMRLRTMNPGAVVGELGLYLNERRTASIFADGDCVVFRMSREAIGKMQAEDPALASAFHQSMLHLVASRLVATSRTLQMVLE
jgi:SulP family sulfate permease